MASKGDFALSLETESGASLKSVGSVNYQRDRAFRILALALADDDKCALLDGEARDFATKIASLGEAVKRDRKRIVCHNASFDMPPLAWGNRDLAEAEWFCSASLARLINLPGALADAVAVAFFNEPPLLKPSPRASKGELFKYRKRATQLAWRLYRKCLKFYLALSRDPNAESNLAKDITTHLRINARGIPVNMRRILDGEARAIFFRTRANEIALEITGHAATNRGAARRWIEKQRPGTCPDESVASIMAAARELGPQGVRLGRAIAVAGKTSQAKWNAFLRHTEKQTSRMYNSFVFAEATTGRFASWGAQVHNVPRGNVRKADGSLLKCNTANPDELTRSLRLAVQAPQGRSLIVADWAQIELRVLLYSAGHDEELKRLHEGEDLYVEVAAKIYNKPIETITKTERALGKAAVLGLGYGLGAGGAAERWGIDKELATRTFDTYHDMFPGVRKFWRRQFPGRVQAAEAYEKGRYVMHLPSGRPVIYWQPNKDVSEYRAKRGDKVKTRLWGAKMCEHFCSGTARDILMLSLRRLEEEGIETIMHIHDEIVVECEAWDAGTIKERMIKIMETEPEWLKYCPLSVEARDGNYWAPGEYQ